jgi:excinuclease ABC subunit A
LDLTPKMQVDRYKIHDIEIVVDRIVPKIEDRYRISQSVGTALKVGKGSMLLLNEAEEVQYLSQNLMDPEAGISYETPSPNSFSFNSPYGSCPTCNGLGKVEEITEESIIPDKSLSISRGGIVALGEYRELWIFKQISVILKKYKANISTPIEKIPEEALRVILYGSDDPVAVPSKKYPGEEWNTKFEGIINFLKRQQESDNDKIADWLKDFMLIKTCPDCEGARLKIESRHFKIHDKNISELAEMDVSDLAEWFENIEENLTDKQNQIAVEILKEIRKRIGFLNGIGLNYLTLNRPIRSLSGGEAQRIRLATQIGTQLVGVLYIMDEPSIGLHQRDNVKLITALKDLRDLGNTVLIVEHDKDMMLESDYILDIGPGAGRHGGKIVGKGTPDEFLKNGSKTADFLSGRINIEIPKERRPGNGEYLILKGAKGHNLHEVDLKIPLGKMICVTGVSGSGKSTLIHDTLFPILNKHFYRAKREPLEHKKITGLEFLDKVIEVDQSPIGRTPRSNPATYTGMFTDIRSLFAELPESKIRGYKPGRFSFNVKGGRCETCQGGGKKKIEMDFLPDVFVECETCKGKRFNRETLEVRFKGKSISDVLDMTVEEALSFFEKQPRINRKVEMLFEVGLGYITLGQHATTLSGGEAQRVKLSEELSKRDTGKTIYILDEPTTGLHFQDIQKLLDVLQRLADKGNTVLIIEHNMDVIKVADHIIDVGPEGGNKGGLIVAQGTPEQVAKVKGSYTGFYLAKEMV